MIAVRCSLALSHLKVQLGWTFQDDSPMWLVTHPGCWLGAQLGPPIRSTYTWLCSFCFSQHGAWVPRGCIPRASVAKGTVTETASPVKGCSRSWQRHFHYMLLVKTATDLREWRKSTCQGHVAEEHVGWDGFLQSSLANSLPQGVLNIMPLEENS